jgi:DNA-binding MarR family transcriptional regulator
MKLDSLFASLSLSVKHARLYRALLSSGPLTIAELARGAKVHRPVAYALVPDLEERGIIKRVLSGKRVRYAAESPEKLEVLLEESRHASSSLLLELKELYGTRRKSPEISVASGKKGIAGVYDDILHTLKRGDTFYRYSSAGKKRPRHAYVPANYEARRDAKRLERYVITNKRTSALKAKKLERYIKIIPAEFDKFEYDITLLVYGNKVAYVDYTTDTAITIENPAIAQFQQKLFKLLFAKL